MQVCCAITESCPPDEGPVDKGEVAARDPETVHPRISASIHPVGRAMLSQHTPTHLMNNLPISVYRIPRPPS